MKRLLVLFSMSLMIFSCDTAKDKEDNKESTLKSGDTSLLALIKSKNIKKAKAEAMIKRFRDEPGKFPTKIDYHRNLYDAAVELYGEGNVLVVPVTFSKDDGTEYCEAWEIPDNGTNCAVEGLNAFILQILKGSSLVDDSEYFQYVTICPPPYNDQGECATPLNPDSTKTTDSLQKGVLKK